VVNPHLPATLRRADLQDEAWRLTLNGQLYTVDVPDTVQSILDVGCGAGSWCIDVAKERPSAQVVGVDLTPPDSAPLKNLKFAQMDAEKPWHTDKSFDLVHGRMLDCGIRDWASLFTQCFQNLNQGGWIEIQGLCHPFRAENPKHDSNASPFIRWGQAVTKVGALKNGYDGYAATKHADRLREAGFANVSEQSYIWPIGTWQSTEQQKQLGEITLENFNKNLNLVGAKVIAHESVMSAEEAQSLVAEVQQDLKHDLESKRYYMSM
jgi:SAM-dependent methyltransferase